MQLLSCDIAPPPVKVFLPRPLLVHPAPDSLPQSMLAAALRRGAAPARHAAAAARGYAAPTPAAAPTFSYTDLFAPAAPKDTPYRKITSDGVSTVDVAGQRVLQVRVRSAGRAAEGGIPAVTVHHWLGPCRMPLRQLAFLVSLTVLLNSVAVQSTWSHI